MSDTTASPPAVSPALPPSLIASLAAAVGAVVYATHLYLYHRLQQEPASFPDELAEAAVHFGTWALLAPLVLRISRRWTLLDRRWPTRLLGHLACGLTVALAQLVLHTVFDQVLIHGWANGARIVDEGRRFFVRTYYANVIVYFALVVADGTFAWAQRRHAREAELERGLTQAQLDALRQQLQPHFLFNALNAVSTLVGDDPPAAQRMIARLADLLRHALDPRNAAEVPLARELELAGAYLAIEHVRFGDRLTLSLDIASAARHALVPGLVLQPLLENAVRHGLACRPGPGTIEIAARVEGATLRLRIADRGVERPASPAASSPLDADGGHGIGLANVRARLRHLYGEAQRLDVAFSAEGTTVDVRLPLRHAETTLHETGLGRAARR